MSNCNTCDGRGRVKESGWDGRWIPCSECNGTGNHKGLERKLLSECLKERKLLSECLKLHKEIAQLKEEQVVSKLRPMETAPRDGSYMLLFGDSGYLGTPLRCVVCKYDPEYRPLQPWVTHSDDSFLDSGGPPVGWMPLPDRE